MVGTDPLRQMVDNTVDNFFGELVELHPWRKDAVGGGYTSSSGDADSSRPVRAAMGIKMSPPENAQVYVGTTEMLVGSVWVSVMEENMAVPADWRRGDRVYLSERNEWFELNYVGPSSTHRYSLHLIRIKQP